MNPSCPFCSCEVSSNPAIAGKTVACPKCGKHFVMPSSSPPSAPRTAPPVINTGYRPQSASRSGGGFLSTTAGVVAGLAIFFIGMPILMCGGCLVLGGIGAANMPEIPDSPATSSNEQGNPKPKLTMAAFRQVQTGMKKPEVFGILGNKAELVSENRIGGITTEMWVWSGDWGANCNVMFQNGKVMQKAQFGLK